MIDKINVGISDLVNLLYNTGNLVSVNSSDFENGNIYHRYIQNRYAENDQKEVYVNKIITLNNITYNFNGRIDGIIVRNDITYINEIKTTRIDLSNLEDLIKINHLYQAMLYSYMYYENTLNENDIVLIRISYINIVNQKIKDFDFEYTLKDLKIFFDETVNLYHSFNLKLLDYQNYKLESIKNLKFPFETLRKGQKELMLYNLDNIKNEEILYIIAPTGIGKTMSLIYSSLKALKEPNDKIFYLTSKNSLKNIAIDAIEILKQKNLKIKTIELTSKEKICFNSNKKDCKNCIYNENYYNKLFTVILDAYDNYDILDKDTIEKLAFKYNVCPFELSLDLSNYSDIIIGDYNYAFCPKSHLIRYFDDENYNNILLVDEAHNLVSRSMGMYSSEISLKEIKELKDKITYLPFNIRVKVDELYNYIKRKSYHELDFYYEDELDFELINIIKEINFIFDELIENEKITDNEDVILKTYFQLKEFNKISDFFNMNFKMIYDYLSEDFYIKIMCFDASDYILRTIQTHAKSASFFSATMSPLNYYKTLLTKDIGHEITFSSSFDSNNFLVATYKGIEMTYQNRLDSIDHINNLIYEITQIKEGNYICFFPSYEFMNNVYDLCDFKDLIYLEDKNLNNFEKDKLIKNFLNEKNKIGFFVIGGSFSEGIDYLGDALSGVMIFSLCLPQFNEYNNLYKEFYETKFNQGYDYAYKFKSIEKIIQAAGRVIRSETDYGFCILVDPRFDSYHYKKYFPKSFKNYHTKSNLLELKSLVSNFFSKKNEI
jgi:DNA excision repair protein ERCC-2